MTHLAIQFAAFPRKGRVEDGSVDGPSTLMRMVGEELGMETQGMQAGQGRTRRIVKAKGEGKDAPQSKCCKIALPAGLRSLRQQGFAGWGSLVGDDAAGTPLLSPWYSPLLPVLMQSFGSTQDLARGPSFIASPGRQRCQG